MAYKKRFEDFEKKELIKRNKYYEICNDADKKREEDIRKMAGGNDANYYDYYHTREKSKQLKAEELKDNCYQSMKNTIEQNYKNEREIIKRKQEEAKLSANELQNYLKEERMKKGDRKFKNEYRSILESQVKMKNKEAKFKINDFEVSNSGCESEKRGKNEMYMIPGINSVSPFVNTQAKGHAPLGEHYSKMKNYINSNRVNYLFLI